MVSSFSAAPYTMYQWCQQHCQLECQPLSILLFVSGWFWVLSLPLQSGVSMVREPMGPLTAAEAQIFDGIVRGLGTSDGGFDA